MVVVVAAAAATIPRSMLRQTLLWKLRLCLLREKAKARTKASKKEEEKGFQTHRPTPNQTLPEAETLTLGSRGLFRHASGGANSKRR